MRIFGACISNLRVVIRNSSEMARQTRIYFERYCNADANLKLSILKGSERYENQNFPDFTSRQLVSHLHNELSSDKTHFAIKCTPLNDDLIDVLFTGLPPHIESLSIDFDLNIFRSSTNYVFEHVKRFSLFRNEDQILTKAMRMPPPIDFARLEVLELRCPDILNDEWLEFISKNEHLVKLKLKRATGQETPFENDQWRKLIAAMPNLKVLEVDARLINYNNYLEYTQSSSNYSVDIRLYIPY